jgi:hypothetical protein
MMGATAMEDILKQIETLVKREAALDELQALYHRLTEFNAKATSELNPLVAL